MGRAIRANTLTPQANLQSLILGDSPVTMAPVGKSLLEAADERDQQYEGPSLREIANRGPAPAAPRPAPRERARRQSMREHWAGIAGEQEQTEARFQELSELYGPYRPTGTEAIELRTAIEKGWVRETLPKPDEPLAVTQLPTPRDWIAGQRRGRVRREAERQGAETFLSQQGVPEEQLAVIRSLGLARGAAAGLKEGTYRREHVSQLGDILYRRHRKTFGQTITDGLATGGIRIGSAVQRRLAADLENFAVGYGLLGAKILQVLGDPDGKRAEEVLLKFKIPPGFADEMDDLLARHPEWQDMTEFDFASPKSWAGAAAGQAPFYSLMGASAAVSGGAALPMYLCYLIEGQQAHDEAIRSGASASQARWTGLVAGMGSAAIEFMQWDRALKFAKGAKRMAGRQLGQGIVRRLGLGESLAVAMGEGGEEFLQAWTHAFAQWGIVGTRPDWEKTLRESAKESVIAFGLFGIPIAARRAGAGLMAKPTVRMRLGAQVRRGQIADAADLQRQLDQRMQQAVIDLEAEQAYEPARMEPEAPPAEAAPAKPAEAPPVAARPAPPEAPPPAARPAPAEPTPAAPALAVAEKAAPSLLEVAEAEPVEAPPISEPVPAVLARRPPTHKPTRKERAQRQARGRERGRLEREITEYYERETGEMVEQEREEAGSEVVGEGQQYGVRFDTTFAGKIPAEVTDHFEGGKIPIKYRQYIKGNVPYAMGEETIAAVGTDEFLRRVDMLVAGKKGDIARAIDKAQRFAEETGDAAMLLRIRRYRDLLSGIVEGEVKFIDASEFRAGDTFEMGGAHYVVRETEGGAITVENDETGEIFKDATIPIDPGTWRRAEGAEARPEAPTEVDLFGRPTFRAIPGREAELALEPGEVREAAVGEVAVKPQLLSAVRKFASDPLVQTAEDALLALRAERKGAADELFAQPADPMREIREAWTQATKGAALFPAEPPGAPKRIVSEEAYDQALKDLAAPEVGGGFLPFRAGKLKSVAIVGAYHIESGVRKFGAWANKVVADLKARGIPAWRWPNLATLWRNLLRGAIPGVEISGKARLQMRDSKTFDALWDRIHRREAGKQWARERVEKRVGPPKPAEIRKAMQALVKRSDEQLKGSLKRQVRAAATGWRAGQVELQATREQLLKFASEHLPKAELHRILPALSNLRTPAERRFAARSINRAIENYERLAAIAQYRGARKRAREELRRGRLRPDAEAKISAILDSIQETTHGAELLSKMRGLERHLELTEDPNVPQPLKRRMESVLSAEERTPLRKLEPDTIRSIADYIDHLLHLNAKKNQLYFSRKSRKADEVMAEATEEVGTRHPQLRAEPLGVFVRRERAGGIRQFATWEQVSLETKGRILGGEDSQAYHLLAEAPLEGERRRLEIVNEASDILQGLGITPAQLNKLSDAAAGPPRRFRKLWRRMVGTSTETLADVHKVTLPRAHDPKGNRIRTLELTDAEHASLIAHLTDSSTRQQLLQSASEGVTFAYRQNRAVKLYAEDIAAIEAAATEEQKRIVAKVKGYVNGPMRDYLNEAWVANEGHKIARRTDHWPRRRDRDYKENEPSAAMAYWKDRQLHDMGIFKPRTGDTAPIIIGDIFAEFLAHVNKTAAYIGKEGATLDALRLLGNPGFRDAVKRGFRHGGALLSDMERTVKAYRGTDYTRDAAYERWVRGLLRKAHVGILGARPRIMFYQVVSFFTALNDIPFKHWGQFWRWRLPTAGVTAEVERISPVAKARFHASGHQILTPQNVGSSLVQSVAGKEPGWINKAMGGIRLFDKAAIVNIFQVAKAEIADEQPALKGKALDAAVARRAERHVHRTQPTWDAITSSSLARESRRSLFHRLATLFSSQRSKNLNMAVWATSEFRHSPRAPRDYVKMVKGISLPILVNSAAIYGIYWLTRRAYAGFEPEKEKRRLAEHAFGVLRRVLGNWIIVGDAIDATIHAMRTGFAGEPVIFVEPQRHPIASASVDLLKGMAYLFRALDEAVKGKEFAREPKKGEPKWRLTAMRGVERLALGVGTLTGIPFRAVHVMGRRWLPTRRETTTYYYDMLWDAAKHGDGARGKIALAGLKELGAPRTNVLSSWRSRKLSEPEWDFVRNAWAEMGED